MYDVVFSEAFHSNFTASTSKHSELLAGFPKTAFDGFWGVGGGSTGPLPSPSPSALPPHDINKILIKNTVDNKTFFITL